jgi:hypothetical protein
VPTPVSPIVSDGVGSDGRSTDALQVNAAVLIQRDPAKRRGGANLKVGPNADRRVACAAVPWYHRGMRSLTFAAALLLTACVQQQSPRVETLKFAKDSARAQDSLAILRAVADSAGGPTSSSPSWATPRG